MNRGVFIARSVPMTKADRARMLEEVKAWIDTALARRGNDAALCRDLKG